MDKILIALGLREAKRVVIRRDPLTEVADIIVSEEAMDMIWFALKTCPPGTALRWNKLVTVANREIPPGDTIEEEDPIRLNIDEEKLKAYATKGQEAGRVWAYAIQKHTDNRASWQYVHDTFAHVRQCSNLRPRNPRRGPGALGTCTRHLRLQADLSALSLSASALSLSPACLLPAVLRGRHDARPPRVR